MNIVVHWQTSSGGSDVVTPGSSVRSDSSAPTGGSPPGTGAEVYRALETNTPAREVETRGTTATGPTVVDKSGTSALKPKLSADLLTARLFSIPADLKPKLDDTGTQDGGNVVPQSGTSGLKPKLTAPTPTIDITAIQLTGSFARPKLTAVATWEIVGSQQTTLSNADIIAIRDAVLNAVIEYDKNGQPVTLRGALRLSDAIAAALSQGFPDFTDKIFKSLDGVKDRIRAKTDEYGNRTNVDIDLT